MVFFADPHDSVASVRRFTRFYTRWAGVLRNRLLHTPYSLGEVRVLYELARRQPVAAGELARELGLDAGYLSRVLVRFEKAGHICRIRDSGDRRSTAVRLTASGQAVFEAMNAEQSDEVARLLDGLDPGARRRLVGAMRTIEEILGGRAMPADFVIRPHEPGDMAYVAHRQTLAYAREHAWGGRFEATLCSVSGEILDGFDPEHERIWIAERDGRIVGSIVCARCDEATAKLRLLYVEPDARGLGIGRRLVEECIRFARRRGYRTMALWTSSALVPARRIYEAAGFRLVDAAPHAAFGEDESGERWEMDLAHAGEG